MARMFSEDRLVRISQVASFNNRIPDSMLKLREVYILLCPRSFSLPCSPCPCSCPSHTNSRQAEETHVILELYAWLANRFENAFCDLEIVQRQIAKNSILIQVLPALLLKPLVLCSWQPELPLPLPHRLLQEGLRRLTRLSGPAKFRRSPMSKSQEETEKEQSEEVASI
eukprot:761082-Hanusia_phi.AAC.7